MPEPPAVSLQARDGYVIRNHYRDPYSLKYSANHVYVLTGTWGLGSVIVYFTSLVDNCQVTEVY